MTQHTITSVGIIGLGIIGGGMAALIQQYAPSCKVKGYDPNPAALRLKASHIVDEITESIDQAVESVDLVIIATPIAAVISVLDDVLSIVDPNTIITDVASVKVPIVDAITQLNTNQIIIPGHPMGGTHRHGVAHISGDYLRHAHYILTPMENQSIPDVFLSFLKTLTFNVTTMDATRHDQFIAKTSHFPYLISSAMVSMFTGQVDAMRPLMGPGINSMTRLSASSLAWGESVCHVSKEALIEMIDEFQTILTQLKADLNDPEAVSTFLSHAQKVRRLGWPDAT